MSDALVSIVDPVLAIKVSQLGRVDYAPTYAAMQEFTGQRGTQPANSLRDQLWICEHPPVFTQGLAGKPEHVLNAGSIPIIAANRGGQVTYHGPGQVVAYPMIDLKRAGYFVKEYVYRIEEAVIRTLAHFNVTGHRVRGAPGIYVRLDDPGSHKQLKQLGSDQYYAGNPADQKPHGDKVDLTPINYLTPINSIDFAGLGKIAALGIKVSRHFTYHGVALNVAMDLEPFSRINPCGYAGLQTVDLSTIGVSVTWQEAADVLSSKLVTYLAP
jgi:lipoyl(octanoyl) transferase